MTTFGRIETRRPLNEIDTERDARRRGRPKRDWMRSRCVPDRDNSTASDGRALLVNT
jgi:hypothetical protein